MKTLSSYDLEDTKRVRLLVTADTSIERPDLKDDWLVIPEGPRQRCEAAIEIAANVLAVSRHCARSISSPHPALALEGESVEEADWLAQQAGIFCLGVSRSTARAPIDLAVASSALQGRLDGVFLMAEALTQGHASGRFHELMRVFERAFARSGDRLTRPLTEFLTGTPHNFTRREVQQWTVRLRHPLTHADERREILLEADASKVISRMEEAAYDVLFNKAEWHTPSTVRRDALKHRAGSTGRGSGLFLTQGLEEQRVECHLFDPFGTFPIDGTSCLTKLPDGWWARFSNEERQEERGRRDVSGTQVDADIASTPSSEISSEQGCVDDGSGSQ